MPGPGTPFGAFAKPYAIRVDDFTDNSNEFGPTKLYLLTHTHSDHVVGLQAKSFAQRVFCSQDAREMLMKYSPYYERALHDDGLRAEKNQPFARLNEGGLKLITEFPLHKPVKVPLSEGETVTITALDANHCPGAIMYLIEGTKGNILHTGDFRAEPRFLDYIKNNPFLQPYLAPEDDRVPRNGPVLKQLDAIYLDTACVFSQNELPSKEEAVSGLVEMMKMFDDKTYFFLNTWTWGYEDILKGVARAFNSQIHVDEYKYSIYKRSASDPFMKVISTMDPEDTRFHACERFKRCNHVNVDDRRKAKNSFGQRVVYINPVSMNKENWKIYLESTKSLITLNQGVTNLLVPLHRHSSLPELKEFVFLFRPKRVVPNTLINEFKGFDWLAIDRLFEEYTDQPSCPASVASQNVSSVSIEKDEADTAIKNLIGEGAEELAQRWADSGRMKKRFNAVVSILKPDKAASGADSKAASESDPNSSPRRERHAESSSDYGSQSQGDTDAMQHLVSGYFPERGDSSSSPARSDQSGNPTPTRNTRNVEGVTDESVAGAGAIMTPDPSPSPSRRAKRLRGGTLVAHGRQLFMPPAAAGAGPSGITPQKDRILLNSALPLSSPFALNTPFSESRFNRASTPSTVPWMDSSQNPLSSPVKMAGRFGAMSPPAGTEGSSQRSSPSVSRLTHAKPLVRRRSNKDVNPVQPKRQRLDLFAEAFTRETLMAPAGLDSTDGDQDTELQAFRIAEQLIQARGENAVNPAFVRKRDAFIGNRKRKLEKEEKGISADKMRQTLTAQINEDLKEGRRLTLPVLDSIARTRR